jgi:hypothetical protein
MDDESFKIELLNRLDRIQTLLSYLCASAKSAAERSQAESAAKLGRMPEKGDDQQVPGRALLQDEMQADYDQAVQKWRAGKVS